MFLFTIHSLIHFSNAVNVTYFALPLFKDYSFNFHFNVDGNDTSVFIDFQKNWFVCESFPRAFHSSSINFIRPGTHSHVLCLVLPNKQKMTCFLALAQKKIFESVVCWVDSLLWQQWWKYPINKSAAPDPARSDVNCFPFRSFISINERRSFAIGSSATILIQTEIHLSFDLNCSKFAYKHVLLPMDSDNRFKTHFAV